jgi:hypothetical protein
MSFLTRVSLWHGGKDGPIYRVLNQLAAYGSVIAATGLIISAIAFLAYALKVQQRVSEILQSNPRSTPTRASGRRWLVRAGDRDTLGFSRGSGLLFKFPHGLGAICVLLAPLVYRRVDWLRVLRYQDGIKRMPLALNIHPGAWALFCFASGAFYWLTGHRTFVLA